MLVGNTLSPKIQATLNVGERRFCVNAPLQAQPEKQHARRRMHRVCAGFFRLTQTWPFNRHMSLRPSLVWLFFAMMLDLGLPGRIALLLVTRSY